MLQMYSKWGYDETSKDIQRRTTNGFITMREAQRIVTGTPNLRSIRTRNPATEALAVHEED